MHFCANEGGTISRHAAACTPVGRIFFVAETPKVGVTGDFLFRHAFRETHFREGVGEQSARQALRVDSTLAEAHAALGHVLCLRWRFEEAEHAYRRSFEHSPNLLAAHGLYSEFLSIINRPDDAIRHAEIAKEHGSRDGSQPAAKVWS